MCVHLKLIRYVSVSEHTASAQFDLRLYAFNHKGH